MAEAAENDEPDSSMPRPEEIKIVPAKVLENILFENFGFLFGLKQSTTTTATTAPSSTFTTSHNFGTGSEYLLPKFLYKRPM